MSQHRIKSSVVAYSWNPNTLEVEMVGFEVQDHSQLLKELEAAFIFSVLIPKYTGLTSFVLILVNSSSIVLLFSSNLGGN